MDIKYQSKENLSLCEQATRIGLSMLVINIAIYSPIAGTMMFPVLITLAIVCALTGVMGHDPIKSLFETPRFHRSAAVQRRLNALK